jgi:hypothetical protein
VEFQPSSWAKGSYLNVGGMWLFDDNDVVKFNVGHRVTEFIGYETDEQFEPEAEKLALTAASEIERLRIALADLEAAIHWLSANSHGGRGRPGYALGVALGLAGRRQEAARCLRGLTVDSDDREWWLNLVRRAHSLADLVEDDPEGFLEDRRQAIGEYRTALKLPADVSLPF